MKKITIAILLSCIIGIAFAQVNQPLDGFWGIKWGSDISTVKEAVKNKGTYDLLVDIDQGLAYSGIFGGSKAIIVFTFDQGKLYLAAVGYPYKTNMTIQKYLEVKSQLTEKYGKPEQDIQKFVSPYFFGDGYEETAIKVNKAFFMAKWIFSDQNNIVITITSELEVVLQYENVEMKEKIDKKVQEKNMSDF